MLCYFAVHGHVEPLYEAIIYSCCGSATPELIALVQGIITRSNHTNGKNQRSR